MKSPYDVILRPIITEQSMEAVADKKYVFEVARDSNKVEIRKAIETIFKVKVLSVNTLNVKGKENAWASIKATPRPAKRLSSA